MRRVLTGEEMWAGNRETFKQSFMSRDFHFVVGFDNVSRKRRRYIKLLGEDKLSEKDVFIFRYPAEAENFLRRVEQICK
jgi:hypothetical protein